MRGLAGRLKRILKTRFKAVWAVARGRPTVYGVTFLAPVNIQNDGLTVLTMVECRVDLREYTVPDDMIGLDTHGPLDFYGVQVHGSMGSGLRVVS